MSSVGKNRNIQYNVNDTMSDIEIIVIYSDNLYTVNTFEITRRGQRKCGPGMVNNNNIVFLS